MKRVATVLTLVAIVFSRAAFAEADALGGFDTTRVVEQALAHEGVDTVDLEGHGTSATYSGSHAIVEAAVRNNKPMLEVSSDGGGNAGFLIPDAEVHDVSIVDGALVAEGKGRAKPSFVLAAGETGATISVVIPSPEAPSRYTYSPLNGATVELEPSTGGALIYDVSAPGEAPNLSGIVHAPWAVDATGRYVPTHFEINDGNLVQVVDHTSADFQYPIVADPSWDEIKAMMKKAGKSIWDGTTWVYGKGKVFAKRIGPGALVLCAVGGGWAWYRSDADGWVRVGDAVTGCIA